MNKNFRDYLEKCRPATADQSILDDFRSAMKQAVPEIVETVKQREKAAAQFRITALTPSHSKPDNQDTDCNSILIGLTQLS